MLKPKEKWQANARSKMASKGLGYKELADATGLSEDVVAQALNRANSYPSAKKAICEYLGIKIKA